MNPHGLHAFAGTIPRMNTMANKTTPIELKPVKPGQTQEFGPTFEVTDLTGHGKRNGEYLHATLTPRGGGAHDVGTITLRMPYILTPGSTLSVFAGLCGQDPAKGFDPSKCKGQRIRMNLIRA